MAAIQFLLQLGVLILAARLGGALFRYWRLPSVIGELAAGMVIGPHLLGRLLAADLFLASGTSAARDGLVGVVALAMMALLFLIGLETDVRLLRRHSLAGALSGAGGTLLALLAGIALVVACAPSLLGRAAAWSDPDTLLVGVAVAVTSMGLVARSLARLRLIESPEGRVALSAASVDSLLAVVLLTTAAGLAHAAAAGQPATPLLALQVLIKTLAAGAATGAAAWVLARQTSRLAAPGREAGGMAVYGLGLALVAGGVFWFLGLSPLMGAYVMGVAFSATDIRHQVQDRLEILHAAFVPACFALVGTMVDPALLLRPPVLAFAAALTVTALAAKAAGSGLPAWFAGLNAAGCLRVGVLMIPRGEMTLAALLVALGADVLSGEALAAVVVLFAVSGILSPRLAEAAFARGGTGTRRGFPAAETVRLAFNFPSPNTAGLVMSRLIELFEDEGFFINLLNRREFLYQFTRERSVLGVQRHGTEIVFSCAATDRDLVNTAMIEVAAGIEQSLHELRLPLDVAALRKRQQEERAPRAALPPGAALREFLAVETMLPRLLSDDKAGVIGELLDRLDERGLLRDRRAAAAAVFEREQSLPTGLTNGIAIPHGRTDAVDRLVCAVGLKPGGVDFDAMDGKPARIVVLALAPLHAAAPQLQFISLVSQILGEQGRAALLACDTAEDMYAVLTGALRVNEPRHPRPVALAGLAWQSVSLDLKARTRDEALDQLIALCARSGAVVSPEDARQAVFAREHKVTTALEDGLALPHARTEAVDRLVCAIGISRDGLDFGAPDGRPTHLFVMTLAPHGDATEYTRHVAALTRALDAAGRQAVLAARTSQEVLAVLHARAGAG